MAVIADSTSFKTTAYPRSIARRLGLTGFGHWWRRELAAAMPERLRAALERRRARPVLAFDGNTATLWRPAPSNGRVQMSEVARVALDGDAQTVAAAGRAALAPLVATAGKAPQIVVALSARASLRKTLTLPMALEDHLRQSLAYDLDRHTPFKPEELYFDAVIVDRDHTHNTLRVDLAAARRALVDTVLRQADAFGARVVAVTVDPPATASASPINLLPEERRLESVTWARWQVVLPAAILAIAVVAALFLPIWQKRADAIALNHLSDEARQRAGVSDALRTELERRVSDYNFALERKYAFPGTVQVLDDVSRILPDDTWLTQFELHTMRGKDAQRELTLRGESANAGRLVSLLEDSKLFTQAAPRSPTTKIQPGPGEIFDVSAHLKALPAPTALPIDMTPPVRPTPPSAPARPVQPAASGQGVAAPGAPGAATSTRPTAPPTVTTPAAPSAAPAAPPRPPGSPPVGIARPPNPSNGAPPAASSGVPAPSVPASAPSSEPEAPRGEENGG